MRALIFTPICLYSLRLELLRNFFLRIVLFLVALLCLCCLQIESAFAFIAEPFPVQKAKEGSIGIRNSSFLNKEYTESSNKKTTTFGGRITSPVENEEFGLGLDVEGQFVEDNPVLNTFTAHEFYFKVYPEWQNSILYLGRKKQAWSELDSNWQMGAWQPVFKADPLDMRDQGLTGFFMDIKKPDWSMELFATPFFLPDHGPSIDTRDGQFVQGHPWVNLPPREVNILGEQTPAYYNIEKPAATEVISHKGYALRFRVGKDESQHDATGLVAQVSLGYLPVNQLALGFEGAYNISAQNRLEIGIHPGVIYHKLLGLDLNYRTEAFRIGLSFLREDSDAPEFAGKWTYQKYSPTEFVSPTISYKWNNIETRLSYLKRFGGEAQTLGPQAQLFSKAIPDRFGFSEQLKADLKWQQKASGGLKYHALVRWIQELRDQSDIISLQGGCQIGPAWQVYGGTDLLKSENRNPDLADTGELFQRNDRAYLGVQYVF